MEVIKITKQNYYGVYSRFGKGVEPKDVNIGDIVGNYDKKDVIICEDGEDDITKNAEKFKHLK